MIPNRPSAAIRASKRSAGKRSVRSSSAATGRIALVGEAAGLGADLLVLLGQRHGALSRAGARCRNRYLMI